MLIVAKQVEAECGTQGFSTTGTIILVRFYQPSLDWRSRVPRRRRPTADRSSFLTERERSDRGNDKFMTLSARSIRRSLEQLSPPRGLGPSWTRCRWFLLTGERLTRTPWCLLHSPEPFLLSYRCLKDANLVDISNQTIPETLSVTLYLGWPLN